MKRVLVFSTSLRTEEEVKVVENVLDELVGTTGRWNFDLEDCDRILRVETPVVSEESIIKTLSSRGFDCAPLQ